SWIRQRLSQCRARTGTSACGRWTWRRRRRWAASNLRYSTFLIHRVLLSVLVLLGLSLLIFVIARVIPGDPARIALGPLASRAQIAALRAQMHLGEPLPGPYTHSGRAVVHG